MLGSASPVGTRLGDDPGTTRESGTRARHGHRRAASRAPVGRATTSDHVTRVPFALEPRGRVALELPTHGFSRPSAPSSVCGCYERRRTTRIASASIGEFPGKSIRCSSICSQPSRIARHRAGSSAIVDSDARSGGLLVPRSSGCRAPIVGSRDGRAPAPALGGAATATRPWCRHSLAGDSRRCRSATSSLSPTGCSRAARSRARPSSAPEDLRFAGLLADGGAARRPRGTVRRPRCSNPRSSHVPAEQALGTTPPSGMPERATLRREELAPSVAAHRASARLTRAGTCRSDTLGSAASYGPRRSPFSRLPDRRARRHRSLGPAQAGGSDAPRLRSVRPRSRSRSGQNALDDHRTSIIRQGARSEREHALDDRRLRAVVPPALRGPRRSLNFYLAARKGRPLRARLWLPVWALLTHAHASSPSGLPARA